MEDAQKLDFYQRVYNWVLLIPYGRVSTYGAIAQAIGIRSSARMVGMALNALPLHERTNVPAHRVVNRNGVLTGKHHFGSPERMQTLLEAEGIQVENDVVQNFQQLFWHPLKDA